jgi:hypothetical protein
MPDKLQLAGQRFGVYTALRVSRVEPPGVCIWLAQCAVCGRTKEIAAHWLSANKWTRCRCNRIGNRAQLEGQRFGRLVVTNFSRIEKYRGLKYSVWLVRCDCGEEKEVFGKCLTASSEALRACGTCYHGVNKYKELRRKYKSGLRREMNSWGGAQNRCGTDPGYIKKGIVVCARWRDKDRGFHNFMADMVPRPEGMTLDRIDPEGPYSPGNCRWATKEIQDLNKCLNAGEDIEVDYEMDGCAF